MLILGGCIFARKIDFPAKIKLSDFTVVRWVRSQNFLQHAITATFHQPLLETWLLTPENVCTGFLNKSVETRRRKMSVKTTVFI